MSFVAGIAGGLLSANAAGNAAQAEEQGAQQAENTIGTNQTNANTAQQTALANVTAANQPYQTLGATSANGLNTLLSNGFQAPTLQQAEQTPGYQFQLQQGTQALDENAAANGTLMSGNTGVALQQYGQNLAQNAYQQTYNNALNAYQANASTLTAGTNLGLSSTGQLGQANLTTAGNTANIDLTSGQEIAQQENNAAAARAGGILGQAAGYSSAISGAAQGAQMFAGGL
jgi:hypothetical protein